MAVPDVERDGPERGETEVGRARRFALAITSSIPPLRKRQAPSGLRRSVGMATMDQPPRLQGFEISFPDFRNFGNFVHDRQAHISPENFRFFYFL
jgi:hypothetical protein